MAGRAQATLVDLLDRRADGQPDRVGFVFLDRDLTATRRLSYGDLRARARVVATRLHETAARARGERALLIYPDATEFVPAFWGCVLAGVIAIPAPLPESLSGHAGQRGLQRLLAVAADAHVRFVLTTERLADELRAMAHALPALREVALVATDAIDLSDARHWREWAPAADDLAYLQYTSGSTRTPRGVMLTHANLAHQLEYLRASIRLSSDDIGVTWLPYFHDYGLVDGCSSRCTPGIRCTCGRPAPFSRGRWDGSSWCRGCEPRALGDRHSHTTSAAGAWRPTMSLHASISAPGAWPM